MKPLEAVARALYLGSMWAAVAGFDEAAEEVRACYLDKARAAITALRDAGVTEGMLQKFMCHDFDNMEALFRAMLDAVLEEG